MQTDTLRDTCNHTNKCINEHNNMSPPFRQEYAYGEDCQPNSFQTPPSLCSNPLTIVTTCKHKIMCTGIVDHLIPDMVFYHNHNARHNYITSL